MFNNRNRFRPKRNFGRRYSAPRNTVDQDLLWAISSGKSQGEQAAPVAAEKYVPKHRFEGFDIAVEIRRNIEKKNYTDPTPIQDETIPQILAGRDVIGIANTGTGKTAAFLIPLIDKVFKNRREKVLIVAPTRELALQIQEELFGFAKGLSIYSALCIGGASMGRQRNDLSRNPNFVIGTPGRLKDLLGERSIDLSSFNNVVLDEADRMVDIGFIHDVKYLVSLLSPVRQSLFFSATISIKVREILKDFVKDPVTISVKQQDTAVNVSQDVVKVISREKKIDQLHDLLIQDGFERVLIFGRTKWGVQRLSDELVSRGFKAGVIHGNKRQSQRQKTLEQFKNNQIKILLATDVASRGLDIKNVSHVINYDMPNSYEDYIHRIGRTGRADQKGAAITFVE
ncbi:DEAD/DEAH box helicase [Candidatus Curtissbacteria bacterium]|nr:DEAD/DEAH box helicase [Candidatus Curtissbacteria bacterium]